MPDNIANIIGEARRVLAETSWVRIKQMVEATSDGCGDSYVRRVIERKAINELRRVLVLLLGES